MHRHSSAMLRSYGAILSARFRMLLQYRAAALAGFFTQMFFGLVMIMAYEAFYRSGDGPQPMTLGQVIGYVWLGQAMLAMLPWNVDSEIRNLVRTGTVAYELLRPVDLYTFWYTRALAWRIAPTLLRAVPMFLFAMLALPLVGLEEWALRLPPSAASAAAWALAMLGALLLGCAITMLLNISRLWSVGGDAWVLAAAAVTIFSGMVIPLPLFPDWLQPALRFLPFAGLVDTPFRLYTGNYPPAALWPLLAHQIAWLIALVLVGRWLLGVSAGRIVVQGG